MSRWGLALRSKELVGAGPLTCLTDCCLQLARTCLRDARVQATTLAAELGYASKSGFGNAFKRYFERAPKHY